MDHVEVLDLTPRQRDVLTRLMEGRTPAQIAARLGLSVRTVYWHTRALYRVLDVHTRAELTAGILAHVDCCGAGTLMRGGKARVVTLNPHESSGPAAPETES